MNFMKRACMSFYNVTHDSTPWLTTRRRVCPICKRDIIAPVGEADERSPLLAESTGDWRGDTATVESV